MREGGAHCEELPQPKGGGADLSSLDESRPTGKTPDEGCGLCRLQEGRPHNRTMLEGASGADSGGHTKKEGERDVGAGQEEAALSDLPRL